MFFTVLFTLLLNYVLILFLLWCFLCVLSGTTAVVALYRNGVIWVANAGDSRAVLGTVDENSSTVVSDGEPVEGKAVSVTL